MLKKGTGTDRPFFLVQTVAAGRQVYLHFIAVPCTYSYTRISSSCSLGNKVLRPRSPGVPMKSQPADRSRRVVWSIPCEVLPYAITFSRNGPVP